jgi:cytochrome c biogenesis protein CcmG, thiol:disulfide interchange protein DsbE
VGAACAPPEPESIRSLQPGDAAPDFAAPTLDGDTISLASLRGEAVMLNIWATWCTPCREEMPLLEALHRELAADGLRVVGVSIDASGMASDINYFLDAHDVTFMILHDPAERVMRLFRARAVPETYLIDRDGRIVRRWIGKFDPLADDARRDVGRALGAG